MNTPADGAMSHIERWCRERAITEVEALMPDMSGVARGKVVPVAAYCRTLGLNLPEALVLQTVTGDYPEDQSAVDPSDRDIVLHADERTIRLVPWAAEPTAQVIHDCFHADGAPVTTTPRYVLRRVLDLYREHGWRARCRTGARVLPRQTQRRRGLSAGAAARAIGTGGAGPPVLRHRRA